MVAELCEGQPLAVHLERAPLLAEAAVLVARESTSVSYRSNRQSAPAGAVCCANEAARALDS